MLNHFLGSKVRIGTLAATVVQILALSVVYATVGGLCLCLIETPNFLWAPIWLSAGIALGSLVLWGRKLWPGVWLGFVLVYIGFESWSGVTVSIDRVIVAALIAIGPTFQAWVSAVVLVRLFGSKPLLISSREIWFYLILTGPVLCLISSSWHILILSLAESRLTSDLMQIWYVGWLADATGTLILVTGMFVLWEEPRAIWRQRRLSVGIPLVILLSSLFAYHAIVRSLEQQRFISQLHDVAEYMKPRLAGWYRNATLGSRSWDLRRTDLLAKGESADNLSSIKRLLEYHDVIESVGLAVVVPHENREQFEKSTQGPGKTHVRIAEFNESGELVPAKVREFYLSVQYYYPRKSSKPLCLGYDMASDAEQWKAIQLAVQLNAPVACNQGRPFVTSDDQCLLEVTPFYDTSMPLTTLAG